MPCQDPGYDDYDRHQRNESNRLLLVHQLFQHVHSVLNKTLPEWYRKNATSLDRMTPALCELMSSLNKSQVNIVAYDAHNKTSRKLADWWEEHQEQDKRRIAREKREANHQDKLKKIIAKMTPDELDTLKENIKKGKL